jgi:hypothetical protein
MADVQTDRALLSDANALAKLLASIPFPPSVHSLLPKGFFGRRWQHGESCDYWLASDGLIAVCWRIRGASAAQIYAIRMRFDRLRALTPHMELTRDVLWGIVYSITGDCEFTTEEPIAIRTPIRLN